MNNTQFSTTIYTQDNILTDYPDIISVKQLKDILSIGNNSVYDLLDNGIIKGLRWGRTWKIPKINVIAFMNQLNISQTIYN